MLIPTIRPPGLVGGGASLRKAELEVQEATPAAFETLIDNNVIGTGHDFWTNVQSDGGDIRFYTDSALTNRLPVEIEALNVAGKTCRLWTRLPSGLSALDTIWIGYGNTGSALSQPAASAPFGSQEVYQDDVLRGHDPGVDLTGNISPTITGTAVGSGLNGGAARGFGPTHGVDSSDVVDNNHSTNYQPFSYVAWVYVEADGGQDKVFFCRESQNTVIKRTSGGVLELVQTFGGGTANWRAGSISLDTWTHVGVVYDNSAAANDPSLYINGSSLTLTTDNNSTGSSTNAQDWRDGRHGGGGAQTMDGLIAERMFRSGALSTAYIAALYSNQNAPGSFWSIGAGQAV